jgi:hypothetical protein
MVQGSQVATRQGEKVPEVKVCRPSNKANKWYSEADETGS